MKLVPYSPSAFIHRREVDLVEGRFRQLVESGGRVRPPKAMLFRGERGFGKSWLSFHLHRTVFRIPSLYIALFPLPSEYQLDLQETEWEIAEKATAEENCKNLILWICKRLEISFPNDPSLLEARRALLGGIDQYLARQGYLVLILDSVFEAEWNLLETVEQNLLAPLAELDQVFFVITGRGRPYPWISPALRLGLDEQTLENFPVEKMPGITPHAIEVSGGSPLVAFMLMQTNNSSEVVDYLLEVVPASLERKRIREAFEALCVLDEFREGEMETLLKTYYEAEEVPMPANSIREVRDDLIKTYLLRWDGGGFKVDRSLRAVLKDYLQTQKPNLWQALNRAAYGLYTGFAEKYPQYREAYLNLAIPYQAEIDRAGKSAGSSSTGFKNHTA